MISLRNPTPNTSHVFSVEQIFNNDDFNIIEEIVRNGKFEPAEVNTEQRVNSAIRETNIMWLTGSDQSEPLYQKIAQVVKVVNDTHFCWSLSHIETLQYSEYNVGGHYDFHFDAPLNSMKKDNRKLSFSILLNSLDEYQGGELEIPGQGYGKFKIEKNNALFFPSSIAHRVCPVTSGIRKSLVGWVHGPNFV